MLFDRILDKLGKLKKEPKAITEETASKQSDELEVCFEDLSKEIRLDVKLAVELAADFSDFANTRLVSEIKNHTGKLSQIKEDVKSRNRLDLYDEIMELEGLLTSADELCGLLSEKKTAEIIFPEKIDGEIRLFSEMINDDGIDKNEIDAMKKTLREKQIRRMQKGKFTTRAGLMYLELIEKMTGLKV